MASPSVMPNTPSGRGGGGGLGPTCWNASELVALGAGGGAIPATTTLGLIRFTSLASGVAGPPLRAEAHASCIAAVPSSYAPICIHLRCYVGDRDHQRVTG